MLITSNEGRSLFKKRAKNRTGGGGDEIKRINGPICLGKKKVFQEKKC